MTECSLKLPVGITSSKSNLASTSPIRGRISSVTKVLNCSSLSVTICDSLYYIFGLPGNGPSGLTDLRMVHQIARQPFPEGCFHFYCWP